MTTTNASSKAWPQNRRDELGQLQQLLQEAKSLNNATGTLDRLARIEALATALTKTDLDGGRESFLTFLVQAANSPARTEEVA